MFGNSSRNKPMIDLLSLRHDIMLAGLIWAFVTATGVYSQQDKADDKPLTREEFAQFLEEYRQFKADHEKVKEENGILKSELAAVKDALLAVQETNNQVQIEQTMAKERSALLERVREEYGNTINSLLPGANNLMITGFASATFMDRQNSDSTFAAGVAPIILWKLDDKLFFETELHFGLSDEDTEVDLGYAHISYLLNDYITLGAGKFLLPFGTFGERLHPSWINKLPMGPLVANIVGESGLGFQIRGGIPIGPTKINYAAYIVNGPDFGDDVFNAGRVGFDRNLDNNNNKTGGGRIGFLPIPELEIGYSILGGRIGDSGSEHSGVDTFMQGVDITYAKEFEAIKGRFELRGEAVWANTDDVIFTGPFEPFTFNNKRSAWYVQAAYRPTLIDHAFGDDINLKNFEFIVRYDRLRQPGADRLGLDRDQITFGIDYWIRPNAVLKFAYVYDDARGGPDQDGFFMQMAVGF